MRLALFTLEGTPSNDAMAAFLTDPPGEIVLIGRAGAWGTGRRGVAHLRRSGPRLLPYLLCGYALPGVFARLRRGAGIAQWARRNHVPLIDVGDVNGPACAAAIDAARPDLLVCLHFDRILSAATLSRARLGGVNLHPSMLPHHRGPMPTIHALAEDPPRFGVTVHRMVPRIDAGPILRQVAVTLPPGTTALAAMRALHLAGVPLLRGAITELATHAAASAPPATLPYCPAPTSALLAILARRGRRLADRADLRRALA